MTYPKIALLTCLCLHMNLSQADTPPEIEPLKLTGDIEAQVAALDKMGRIQFGKHLASSICKQCHHQAFIGKSMFENDQYLRESLLARKKNFMAIKIRSKMRHQQMPPDELPKLEKYQWKPIYEYVRYIEKNARQ